MNPEQDFELGPWRVRPSANELVRRGETRRLEHIQMRLLTFLVRNAGRDVPREEILRGVWGEGVHNDEVLTVAVSALRKALDDDARSPTYIKTVPRHGYRFISSAPDADPANAPADRKEGLIRSLEQRVGLRFLIIAAIVGLFLLIILVQVLVELVFFLTR